MATQLVSARIDGIIKEQAACILGAAGLSIADIITIMLTRIAEDKAIPFDVEKPTAETLAAIDDDLHDRTEFVNIDELMAEIRESDSTNGSV